MRRRATVLLLLVTLDALLACGGGDASSTNPQPVTPAPTTGSIVLVALPHGNSRDADGFTVAIDGGSPRTLSYAASVTVGSLVPGEHVVRLAGVAQHCRLAADSASVSVKAGVTDTLRVDASCIGGLAYHQLVSPLQIDVIYLTEDGRTIPLATGPERKLIEGWSPDGTRLLYRKSSGNAWDLYTVRSDGSDTRRVAAGVEEFSRPRWSPDGTRLALVKRDASVAAGSWIVLVGADGSGAKVLVDTKAFDFDPVWSRDGTRLYFGCDRFQRWVDLCSAAVDGGGLRSIRFPEIDALEAIRLPWLCSYPCLVKSSFRFETSPDGRSILFEEWPPAGGWQSVWSGSLDGSRAVQLSSANEGAYVASWSPTSDRVLFIVFSGLGYNALAASNADGTGYRRLTNYLDNDEAGSWSVDGALIAFDGRRNGGVQIWAMNADGSAGRALTAGALGSFSPFWNPKAAAPGPLAAP